MAALGNCKQVSAPAPAAGTQHTAPTTASNGRSNQGSSSNQGVMNGTGVIDTTLNDPDYKDQKNQGAGTANHCSKP